MKAILFVVSMILSSMAFAFGPFEQFGELAHMPVSTPLFWGTHWEGDGHAVDVSVSGVIRFNGEIYSDRVKRGSEGGAQISGDHSESGTRESNGKTFCTLIERGASLRHLGLDATMILTEKIYERQSFSGGYLCKWFASKKGYSLASDATYTFHIDTDYVQMSAVIEGRNVNLSRQVDLPMKQKQVWQR